MNEVYLRYLEVAKRLTGSSDIDTLIDAATKIARAVQNNSQQWDLIQNYIETGSIIGTLPEFLATCRIQHPTRGAIPYILYPFQTKLAETLTSTPESLILIANARQMGLSTLLAGYALYEMVSKPDQRIAMMGTKLVLATEFLQRIRFMAESCALPVSITTMNATELAFSNGSRIVARAASADALRGYTLTHFMMTDVAFVPHGRSDELWRNYYPCLSQGSKCILQTTPNMAKGLFYDLWSGPQPAERIRLPWHLHPERDEAWAQRYRDQLGQARWLTEFECAFTDE